MNNLALYSYYRSSTSYMVRIALELKKLQYEYRPIHLLNNGGEQHKLDYRHINPMGGVPTLIHNQKILAQSLTIIEYLNDVYPEPYPLFPETHFEKAKVKQFCENINADMHAFGNLKLLQYLEMKHGYTQADKEAWISYWYHGVLKSLEHTLNVSSKEFCFGSSITAADVLLVPVVFTCERFKVDLSFYPNIVRVSKNCTLLPAFQRAHPFRQLDTPSEFRTE